MVSCTSSESPEVGLSLSATLGECEVGGVLAHLSARAAREDIEAFLGRPVFLDLGVKVRDGWRSDESALEDLGLDDPNRLEQPSLGPKPDRVA